MNRRKIRVVDRASAVVAAHQIELSENQRRHGISILKEMQREADDVCARFQSEALELHTQHQALLKRDRADPNLLCDMEALRRNLEKLSKAIAEYRPGFDRLRGAVAIMLWKYEESEKSH